MTQTNTIHFDLVSPEENVLSEDVTMATIPGEAGEFGVGADHSAIVSSLRAGVITIQKPEDKAPREYFIAGGFADVTGTQCTILAEEAIAVVDLDEKALTQELENLLEDQGLAKEEADKRRIERAIALVKVKLSAATGTVVI